MRVSGWAIGIAVAAATAAACGLDKVGLLDAASADDAGGADATRDGFADAQSADDDAAPHDDAGQALDAGDDIALDSPPPPPPPDASPAPLNWDGGSVVGPDFNDQDWVAFCVGVAGCGEMPSMSRCMGLMPQPAQADPLLPPPIMIQCVGNATSDCIGVAKCVGGGASCSASTPDSCTGNLLSTCRWGFQATVDCGELGMVCSAGLGNPGCGFGDCAAWQQGQRYCAGQYLVVCDHGRYTPALDCGVFGATCGGTPPAAGCVGTGGGCSGSTPTCAGAKIVQCMGGQLAGADCSQLYGGGFQCVPGSATGSAPRCAQGTMCTPANPDSCDPPGKNAQFCNAGKPGAYDCSQKSLGWQKACVSGKCSN